MARPTKEEGGLLFFSLDINIHDDPAIEYIEAKYPIVGFGIYIKLLLRIYSRGYFVKFEERDQIIFASRINFHYERFRPVMSDLLRENLFSSRLYKTFSILTSKRIQRQYIKALTHRVKITLHEEFLLIDKDDKLLKQSNIKFKKIYTSEETGVSKNETGVSSEEMGVSLEEMGVSLEGNSICPKNYESSRREGEVSKNETGVSKNETGVSKNETGVSSEEMGVSSEGNSTENKDGNKVLENNDIGVSSNLTLVSSRGNYTLTGVSPRGNPYFLDDNET